MKCWSCLRPHTGHVWCPHCSAPVDPGSLEAEASVYWQNDPRRLAMLTPEGRADAEVRRSLARPFIGDVAGPVDFDWGDR